jgi:mono/diheme cytochrome c family protein
MEWTPTPGVNGGLPFTKFFTFGPDGALLLSVNLDGRGEKFMPGTCVACHGGSTYNGRFPEHGNPSPYLGAGFLPFDTGNYLFSSRADLTEAAQSDSIFGLNQLVRATETSANTAVSRLIDGWYASGTHVLDKAYVAPAWQAADAQSPGAARFYHDVVGISCRTCHVSLGARFDWDSIVLSPIRARTHVCGGTPDVALNASMPNALISRVRVEARVQADPALAALMTNFLGCDTPSPDPAYPKR